MDNLTHISDAKKTPETFRRPIPIVGDSRRADFPENIPKIFWDAVLEVESYVQAPRPMIVSSMLGVLSLCAQGVIRVRRDHSLVSNVSLYLVSLAEPNERKSFTESFFIKPIERWEAQMKKRYHKKHVRFEAEITAFNAKKATLEKAIKTATEDGKIKELTNELAEHLLNEPKKPLSPQLLGGDFTRQSLETSLDEDFPSLGIISSEAGLILGGAAFKSDTITNSFSFLNSLWSAEPARFGTRSGGKKMIKDVALTMSIAVQPVIFDNFLRKGGELARGIGFVARSLICFPESTQGNRPYVESKSEYPAIQAFNERLEALLDMQEQHIKERRLERQVIPLSDTAKEVWINYQNAVETEQAVGGKAEFVRDVAGKNSDNATRIAGLFHLLEQDLSEGLGEEISDKHMRQGAKVAEYYLEESIRYLGLTELADVFFYAGAAVEKLISYCNKRKNKQSALIDGLRWNEITHRDLIRYCIHRDFATNQKAAPIINELMETHHISEPEEIGRSMVYEVNPMLFGV